MERDFLGLSSNNSAMKGTAVDGSKDSALIRHSEMLHSFSNKDSAIPQLWSFKASRDDKRRKTVHEPIASSGLISDAFDSKEKQQSVVAQKNIILDGKAGNCCAMSPFAYSVNCCQGVRVFPFSNQSNQNITVSMHAPVQRSHYPSAGQNGLGNFVKTNPQPLGEVLITAPVSGFPNTTPVVGSTDLRNKSKSIEGPAQLTIFYAGSVCVYDDVSPEKALAIKLLAGDGSSTSHGKLAPTAQLQVAPIPRPCTRDVCVGNKSLTTSPCSSLPTPSSVVSHVNSQPGGGSNSTNDLSTVIGNKFDDVSPCLSLPSPISLFSHVNSQPGGGSKNIIDLSTVTRNKPHTASPCSGFSSPISVIRNKPHTASSCSGLPSPSSVISRVNLLSTGGHNNINDLEAVKPVSGLTSLSNQTWPPNVLCSSGPAGATLVPKVAVPQARKASLARFLEKRKDRVLTISPYDDNNESPECSRSGS